MSKPITSFQLIAVLVTTIIGCIKVPSAKNFAHDTRLQSQAEDTLGSEIKNAFALYTEDRKAETYENENVKIMDKVSSAIAKKSEKELSTYFQEQIETSNKTSKDSNINEVDVNDNTKFVAGASILAAGAISLVGSAYSSNKARNLKTKLESKGDVVLTGEQIDRVLKDGNHREYIEILQNGTYKTKIEMKKIGSAEDIKRMEKSINSYRTSSRVFLGAGILASIGAAALIFNGKNVYGSNALKLTEHTKRSTALENLERRLDEVRKRG
ncbi:MAG: hypothetical protein AB8G05_16575 [Oligoflexales bacterium]